MLDMIHPKLRKLLDSQGHVTLPQFADAHRMRYERALDMVRDGVLGAIDFRSEGATRPAYRIFESHISDFYKKRSTRCLRTASAKRRKSTKTRVKQYFDE